MTKRCAVTDFLFMLLTITKLSGMFPYETESVRLWYSGITSAFQAEEAGSIPVGRFTRAWHSQVFSCPPRGDCFAGWPIYRLRRKGSKMGVRGEVYSTKLVTKDRTYFFNVKENVYGDLFLNIVESKGTEGGSGKFIRQSVLVYQEDLGEFVQEFQKTLDFIKQSTRS